MTNDNDLIRRGDARDVVIGWDEGCAMIDAIPAASTKAAEAYRQGWNNAVQAVTPTLIPLEDLAAPPADVAGMVGLSNALRSGDQADMDGTMVRVSRQACEEAADLIETLTARLAAMEAERVITPAARNEILASENKSLRNQVLGLQQHYNATTARAEKAERALANIRELNMAGADENGHRWAHSDLIEQEIVNAMTTATKGGDA